MKSIRDILLVSLSALVGVMWTLPAKAVPAFAHQYDKKCSYCHAAWPQLNAKGRQFKEQGYKLESDEEVQLGDYLQDWEKVPLSALLIARPYDKKERADTKLRALHEAELIVAGAFNKFSGWFEIEAEDETGFDPEVGNLVLAYHHNEWFNLQFLYAPFLWSDPYGLYGDHFRLTLSHVGVIDQTFEGSDGSLRDSRQQVGAYGRIMDKLFWNVGWNGEADNAEGEDASSIHGRLAFDITDDIMVGGFVMNGECSSCSPHREFIRWGIDGQADFKNFRLQAVYVDTEGDNAAATAEEDNNVFSVQGFYTFTKETGRPTFVPLIRYDSFEKSDGTDDKEALTFNLGYYITQNVKAFAEYYHEIDAFAGSKETDRFSLQLFVAF